MEAARKARVPFVAVTCSAARACRRGWWRWSRCRRPPPPPSACTKPGVPLITVLASPTTGGVYASYATQADLIVAEAGAVIGFAGARVRAVHDEHEERQTLHAEDLLAAGQVDTVLPRERMRDYLVRALHLLRRTPAPDPEGLPPPPRRSTWKAAGPSWSGPGIPAATRAALHRRALRGLHRAAGDRAGSDDPAVVAGLGRIGDTDTVIVAQDRGRWIGQRARRRPSHTRRLPQGAAALLLAERLRLPLVTFVDTPARTTVSRTKPRGSRGRSRTVWRRWPRSPPRAWQS